MDDLDTNGFLLACKNGTLDLSTGELRDPDPADLITRLCPVEYDPNAEAPIFDRFLSEVQPSQEVRDYLARLFGYGAVVPQNVVRLEMSAAMITKVTKRTELGPFRALPTARHARVALRHPPEPRAVRAAHVHARRRAGTETLAQAARRV